MILLIPERIYDVPKGATVVHIDLQDSAGEALLGPHTHLQQDNHSRVNAIFQINLIKANTNCCSD